MIDTVDLRGCTALVTGAGQGIGRAIATALGGAGAMVAVNDIVAERAQAVAAEIDEVGGIGVPAVFDVTDYGAVAAAVAELGGIDILVNNAGNAGVEGMIGRGPFAESDPADWGPYLAVNLFGVMNCCRATLPGMVERNWGRIITIVSDAGRTGDKFLAAYSAAKAGAAGLTRALALENGQYGITVNNIALGTMRTPMTEPLWSDPDHPAAKAILRNYAIRRPGGPGDVAPLVLFLTSDGAEWITGQTYPVNGGYSFAL